MFTVNRVRHVWVHEGGLKLAVALGGRPDIEYLTLPGLPATSVAIISSVSCSPWATSAGENWTDKEKEAAVAMLPKDTEGSVPLGGYNLALTHLTKYTPGFPTVIYR